MGSMENGIPAEIPLTFSPKLKIGDPVLFRNANGEPHVMRTEPKDGSARHKLQVAREDLLPGLFGN